jgi:periplasmic divalent cation tolerance protein
MTGQVQDASAGDADLTKEPLPQGTGFLQVQTTTDSRAEAIELGRAAVEARLAACAQVAGPVASTYWWEGEMERAEEWLVLLKLPADKYADLASLLANLHSYDEPEIIATPIAAGSAGYLGWISAETRPHDTS